jgi:hypothetical protein
MPGRYEINHAAVAKLLYGKTPSADMVPIYPELWRRADMVKNMSRILVGKDSGRLARSITLSSELRAPYWWFHVTADTPYALAHHRGTRPHLITGDLKFTTHGKTVHTRVVHHPGTKGNPFLRDALPVFFR